MEDRFEMSQREVKRWQIIQQVLDGRLGPGKAAVLLALSVRQVRRLQQRVRKEGAQGLTHRGRGRPSNRRLPGRVQRRAVRLCQTRYAGFGPTLAAEKLAECNGLTVSVETLRTWLKAAGVPYPQRRRRPHRQWRPRRAQRGELVQVDGSHHAWLEARGPAGVLMAYVDDASSEVFAWLYAYEGTLPALDSFQRYAQRYGLPQALYTDRHSTYRGQGAPSVADELAGRARPQSQFERAVGELGVTVHHAHSPQAKGRVERLFRTFQDRLIKELRLADIRTIEAANAFLDTYLPRYNQRFGVAPAAAADLHRPCPSPTVLAHALCLKTPHTVQPDGTVVHERQWFQLAEPHAPQRVVLEEHLDGSRHLTVDGRRLRYHVLPARPVRSKAVPVTRPVRPRQTWRPSPDHPWKRRPCKQPGRSGPQP
jgi:transposase